MTRHPSSPPPDRGHIATELRNPRSMGLHACSVAQCVAIIQDEDRAIARAMDAARPALVALIEAMEPRFLAGGRVVSLGAGTSGRLAVLDASEMPPTYQIEPSRFVGLIAGGDASLRRSSEGKEDERGGAHAELSALALTRHDTVLGIAAGGTTPYVLGALEFAAAWPARPLVALLTCAPVPTPPGVDYHIVIDTGPEVVTGSTRMKAGTATKLALNTISTTLMVRAGRVHENLMVDLRATNDKLADRAARIVATLTGLDRRASLELLSRAGGHAKVAVAMHRLGLPRAEAEARLDRAGGRLDRALDPSS